MTEIVAGVKTCPAVWAESGCDVQVKEPSAAGSIVNVLLVPVLPEAVSVTVSCERSDGFCGSLALKPDTLAVPTPVPLPQVIAP